MAANRNSPTSPTPTSSAAPNTPLAAWVASVQAKHNHTASTSSSSSVSVSSTPSTAAAAAAAAASSSHPFPTASSSSTSSDSADALEEEVRQARLNRQKRRSRLSGAGVRGFSEASSPATAAGASATQPSVSNPPTPTRASTTPIDGEATLKRLLGQRTGGTSSTLTAMDVPRSHPTSLDAPYQRHGDTNDAAGTHVSGTEAAGASPAAAAPLPGVTQRGAALLSRYGGALGPTGVAGASSNSPGSPMSLASFMGGKASGPRLGKLAGDGRNAPLEATAGEGDGVDGWANDRRYMRPLPGLAASSASATDPDAGGLRQGGLAGFLERRKADLAAKEHATGAPGDDSRGGDEGGRGEQQRHSAALARPASPVRSVSPGARSPSLLPQGGATKRSSSPVRPTVLTSSASSVPLSSSPPPRSPQPPRSASPQRFGTTTSTAIGGGRAAAAAADVGGAGMREQKRSTSPFKRPTSPVRSATSSTPAAAGHAAPSTGATRTTTTTTPSSSTDKMPSASLTRLRGQNLVGQRIKEAMQREKGDASGAASPADAAAGGGGVGGGGSSSPLSPSPSDGAGVVGGVKSRWNPVQATGVGGGGGLGAAPSSSGSSSVAPTAATGTARRGFVPGRLGKALPGMSSPSLAATRAGAAPIPARSTSPDGVGKARDADAGERATSEETRPPSPVRLPGMGGARSPFEALEERRRREQQERDQQEGVDGRVTGGEIGARAGSGGEGAQVLTPLTAGRARGPRRAGTATTTMAGATATASFDRTGAIDASQASQTTAHRTTPGTVATVPSDTTSAQSAPYQTARETLGASPVSRVATTATRTGAVGTATAADDPSISRLLGSEQDTFHPIRPSDRMLANSPGKRSVREVEEELNSRDGPKAGATDPTWSSAIDDATTTTKPRRSTEGKKVVVLISGSGSNLQALIDATCDGRLPDATITLVLSNRKAAFGLTRASTSNPPIPTEVLSLKTWQTKTGGSRDEYDEVLASRVLQGGVPDLVVLAGFMHIVSPTFLRALGHRTSLEARGAPTWAPKRGAVPIINLHPALPGAFDGADAIRRAYDAFARGEIVETGCMVHKVIAEVDRGEPLVVERVAIRRGEILEDLEARMHEVEHDIIVRGARKVLQGKAARDAALFDDDEGAADVAAASDQEHGRDGTTRERTATEVKLAEVDAPAPMPNPWETEAAQRALAEAQAGGAAKASARRPTADTVASTASSADASVQDAPQFTSVRSSVASWGQQQPSQPSGTMPPVTSTNPPRARRRTLSRPTSMYAGSKPSLDDVAEAPGDALDTSRPSARGEPGGDTTPTGTPRSARTDVTQATAGARRPRSMYGGITLEPTATVARGAKRHDEDEDETTLPPASPVSPATTRRLEEQARALEALVEGTHVATPTASVLVRSGGGGTDGEDVSVAQTTTRDATVEMPFEALGAPGTESQLPWTRSQVASFVRQTRRAATSSGRDVQGEAARRRGRLVSVEVLRVLPDGTTSAVEKGEAHVLYDSECLAVLQRHRAEAIGEQVGERPAATGTTTAAAAEEMRHTVHAWIGRAHRAYADGECREAHKLRELASRLRTPLRDARQGREPRELVEALGGCVVTRHSPRSGQVGAGGGRGAAAHDGDGVAARRYWDEASTALYEVREVDACTFIDQVELQTSSLCSAYSYVLSLTGELTAWHGVGSHDEQRTAAARFAEAVHARIVGQSGDHDVASTKALRQLEEADGPNGVSARRSTFGELLLAPCSSGERYADSVLHARLRGLEADERRTRVWAVGSASPKSSSLSSSSTAARASLPLQSLPAVAPSLDCLAAEGIYVVRAPLETYVVVGASARARRLDVLLALDVAEALAHRDQDDDDDDQRDGRSYGGRDAVHVVVYPSVTPRELGAALRGQAGVDDADLQRTTPKPSASSASRPTNARADYMNVVTSAQARLELQTTRWTRASVRHLDWLPVGVAPEHLMRRDSRESGVAI